MQSIKYANIYKKLIEFRQTNPPTGYSEKHHVLPRSMGGTNESSNLVRLTGREHWIAHLLLWKIYKNSEMTHAANMMAGRYKKLGISKINNSRIYEALRIDYSEKARQRQTGKTISLKIREKISQSNLGKHHGAPTEEHRNKISQANLGLTRSPETCERIRQSRLGKTMSSETREKIRQHHTGKTLSSEHRKKISQSTRGKPKSLEHREKLRQAKLRNLNIIPI